MALQAGSINVSATVWDFFDLATSGSYLCFSLESCPFLRVFTQANKIICILDLKQKKCFVRRWHLTLFGTRAFHHKPSTTVLLHPSTVKVNTNERLLSLHCLETLLKLTVFTFSCPPLILPAFLWVRILSRVQLGVSIFFFPFSKTSSSLSPYSLAGINATVTVPCHIDASLILLFESTRQLQSIT